jgi:Pvc16 N-terminal domain
VSNALAIAGVTAVLKDLLDNGLIDNLQTTLGFNVSALAPGAIQAANDSTPRLNLFMYQVTPNAAWRNVGLPSRDASGQRVSNPPLALDLHYLLTAYGKADLEAELLLGYAMQLLHETPVLSRAAIRTALNPLNPIAGGDLLPPIYKALRASDLADQFEQIKITLETMNTEELSKLWGALQAQYRPTAAYQVTVVLIEANKAVRPPLPVLTRGPVDPVTQRERGIVVQAGMVPPFPEIESIKLPKARISALLGDTIELIGHDLDGSLHTLLLSSPRLAIEATIQAEPNPTASAAKFVLPLPASSPVKLRAGSYVATLQLVHGGDSKPRLTNQLSLSIAPQITNLPLTAVLDVDKKLVLKPTCAPELHRDQRVSLILGGIEALAEPFETETSSQPTFTFHAIPAGSYLARLRVDGIDSPLIDRAASPPRFIEPQPRIEVTVSP